MKKDYKTFKEFNTEEIFTESEILEHGWSESDTRIATAQYYKILEDIQKHGELQMDDPEYLAEGILGSILGAAAGLTIGPAIGKAIAKALGAQKGGALYRMLTSRLVLGSLGAAIFKGKK